MGWYKEKSGGRKYKVMKSEWKVKKKKTWLKQEVAIQGYRTKYGRVGGIQYRSTLNDMLGCGRVSKFGAGDYHLFLVWWSKPS